uniref:Uncharacterized protein n=1 Tax=Heterorhabditis bacteriophora TaxID=37862 RepID=A0A1I7X193_HETBA
MIGSVAVPIISQTMNKDVAHTWSIILSWFFPTYSISNIFSIVSRAIFQNSHERLLQLTLSSLETIFTTHLITDTSRKGILIPLLFFAVQGFISWFFIFTKENGLFGRILAKLNILKKRDRVKDVETLKANWTLNDVQELKFEDSDVIDEKSNVKRLIESDSNTAVVVNNLKKWDGVSKITGERFCKHKRAQNRNMRVKEKSILKML